MSSLVPRFPASLIGDFATRWDSFFDNMMDDFLNGDSLISSKNGYPKVDVYEDDKNLRIEASVPGLSKDDVKVEWANDTLTISAQKQTSSENRSKDYHLKELHKSSFSRSFLVKDDLYKVDETAAEVKDGLLLINIPLKVAIHKDVKKISVK